jgi:nicotinamidase-related amidase
MIWQIVLGGGGGVYMELRRVLVDLNTQRDFLCPNGAVRVLNWIFVLPRVRALMRWARRARVPVISSIEAYRPAEPLNRLPRHCIDGTDGQQKLAFTLLPNRILVEADNTYALAPDLLEQYRQVIFHKRTRDLMRNPKADRMFSELRAREFCVFGMTAETSVRSLVLGLLSWRRRVAVVRDACGWWDGQEADLAFRQMEAKGARLVETGELLSEVAGPERQAEVLRRFSKRARTARASGRG